VNDSAATLDRSFQALAHPVRRGIVAKLAGGPATVGDATRDFAVSKPAITKHLKVLEEAGLVERAVRGRSHHLRLVESPLTEAGEWIERHRALLERKFDVVDEYLKEEGR